MHYKGYELAPAAQPLASGLFAANLVIQDKASPRAHAYVFDALDYFFESELAIAICGALGPHVDRRAARHGATGGTRCAGARNGTRGRSRTAIVRRVIWL